MTFPNVYSEVPSEIDVSNCQRSFVATNGHLQFESRCPCCHRLGHRLSVCRARHTALLCLCYCTTRRDTLIKCRALCPCGSGHSCMRLQLQAHADAKVRTLNLDLHLPGSSASFGSRSCVALVSSFVLGSPSDIDVFTFC